MKSLYVLLCLLAITPAFAQSPDLSAPLTLDPAVRTGKLENGITYFIRKNSKPENRMELRLAVNVGSVLEDDSQQGLAHFAEHMAFNGSEHFKKQELVNYLEGIGVRFGADLNAYTSFDETVYMLQLPTDTASIVDKGFSVLEDWAHYVSYDDEEIDKERGVVIEEWRLGRGAEARMDDKQWPIMFQGSKYADRLPIGKKNILESFKHEEIKRFYHDWYRPELMAVIAVGDFDVAAIEAEIKKHFSSIPRSTGGRPRTLAEVPDVDAPRFAIATDPEASRASVDLMIKQPLQKMSTVADMRTRLVQNLYNRLFNARLNELTETADPPFLFGFSGRQRFLRSAEYYFVNVGVKNEGIARGLETMLTEVARVKQHGFTATELEREKTAFLRSVDQQYDERDKTDSRQHVGRLVSHFLNNEPVMGIEAERAIYSALVPSVSIAEINALSTTLITENNRVITVSAPEKPDVHVPSRDELAAIFVATDKKPVDAYVDRVVNKPLVSSVPAPGSIVEESSMTELGITTWKLSNGVRVILKPTDFKNDEILMSAFRPGGTSLASDEDFLSATESASIIDESGVGEFDPTTLRKALSGKIANVSPWFSETHDRLSGSASPKDVKTMFELIDLYFTAPRRDSAEFLSYITKRRGVLQNRAGDPRAAYFDTLSATLAQYHARRQPMTEAKLAGIDLNRAYEFYKSRFADPNGFTFVFVGNFTPASLKPLVETYIGGITTHHRSDMWKDVGVHSPKGVIEKSVRKGIEPKSMMQIVFTGPFQWSPENRWRIQSTCSVLNMKLREQLREEKGGVYGVSAFAQPTHQPRDEYAATVTFPCSPERVTELTSLAMAIIDSVKRDGVADTYIHKIKEQQLRDRETQAKQNRFWVSTLSQYYQNDEDPRVLLKYTEMVNTLSSDMVRDAARMYFDDNNVVKVALYPEK